MNKAKTYIIILFLLINSLFAQSQSESDEFSYALKLYEEKFYDLAAQQFIRFTNKFPASEKLDEAGYYAGMSLYELGEYKNARIEFQNVAVNFPKSKRAPESWFMSGESYLKQGNYEESAKSFEAVKTLYPQHAKAALSTLKAGQQYEKVGLFEKADQLYSLIQERYIESTAYYSSLISQGEMYFKNGKLGDAQGKFEKIVEVNADKNLKAQAIYMLGKLAEQKGYLKEAAKNYNTIISQYKNSPVFVSSSIRLARISIKTGEYSEAQRILNNSLDKVSDATLKDEIFELLGDAHFLNNQYALAQKAYEKCKIDENFKLKNRIKIKIALSWKNQNNINKGIDIINNLINDLPDTLDVYLKLAINLYFEWLEEIEVYDKAINSLYDLKSTPHFSDKLKNKLISFLQYKNKWQDIIRELEFEVQRNITSQMNDDNDFMLGYAYEQINNFKESLRYYNKLILEYPSSKYVNDAKLNIEYINNYYVTDEGVGINRLALLIGNILNAENKGLMQFQLGKIYFENLKDYENAILQLQKALNSPENNQILPDIYYYIGESYVMLADEKNTSNKTQTEYLSNAKEYFSKAMENINSATNPDIIASAFVECVNRVDNPGAEKKINYYAKLIKDYPQSNLVENWHENIGSTYLYDLKNTNSALKEYDYLSTNFKESDNYPRYLLVSAKLKREFNQNVLENYRRIAGEFPNSEYAAEALFNMAEIYDSNGQLKEANQLYQKLLNDYYYTQYALFAKENIGNLYLASEEYQKAIDIYSEKIKDLPLTDVVLRKQNVPPDAINSIFKLGKAFYLNADWQNAIANLALYLNITYDNIYANEAYLLLGDSYYTIKDKNSAIESYMLVDKSDTLTYKNSLEKLANCYFEIENYAESAKVFKNLLNIKTNTDIFTKYIIALIRNGDRKQAVELIKLFEKKYKTEKNSLAAFDFEQGKQLRRAQNYDNALKYFKRVKNSYANTDYDDDAAYYEALIYITLNKQNDALEILTNFPSKYPNSDQLGAVLNTLGGIYFRSEKYESAVISFKNALKKELDPELKRQVLSNLIKTYKFVNFWDAALALSREYIDEFPDADDIIDKKITISQAYVNLNQFDRAIELLRNARMEADSEKEPEIQFYIGEAYLRAGQYESAIAEFVKIPLLSRKTKLQWEASALYYSGQAYEKMGRINEAVRMYQEIVNRPGIDLILKKDAQKRIEQIKS